MASNNEALRTEESLVQARGLVASLPVPDYINNYQVPYDAEALAEALADNLHNPGVASFDSIDDFANIAAAIGERRSRKPIVITNGCAERVRANVPIQSLGENALVELSIIDSSRLVDPVKVQRAGGQFIKPRSSPFEEVAVEDDSEDESQKEISAKTLIVPSFKGEGINSKKITDREPDESRLVAGAIQSRELQHYLTLETGAPVFMAHEALSLAYELPFVRVHPDTGELYLVSAHSPWVGLRTNGARSAQTDLITGLKNVTGAKIGASSDCAHIADLSKTLNPDALPGKMMWMLRFGENEEKQELAALEAIKEHAEGSIILFDIHGITRTNKYGEKIRFVGDIERGIERLAYGCAAAGLLLNGLHLETVPDFRRLECVDYFDQRPEDEGDVDPRLNPRQTRRILDFASQYIN